jgi:hypothetical protein
LCRDATAAHRFHRAFGCFRAAGQASNAVRHAEKSKVFVAEETIFVPLAIKPDVGLGG